MVTTSAARLGLAGAAVVGVAFGMARYAFGLTLPDVRVDLGLGNATLGLIASATFAGYLLALLLVPPLAARAGPRAPTTVGGLTGAVGCLVVSVSQSGTSLSVGAVLAGSAAGWVWAPYSDLVVHATQRIHHAALLALITTGTSAGLVAVGVLDLVSSPSSWRVVWLATALAAVAAALLNLAWVPRLSPRPPEPPVAGLVVTRTALAPLVFAAVYTGVCVVYFTYASDAALDAGLPASSGALVFIVIGLAGLAGLATAPLARRVTTPVAGGGSLVGIGAALALLAIADHQVTAVASATIFGAGYMIGSSCLPIWTAELEPANATRAFTVALVVGALMSIVAPTAVGLLRSSWELSTILLVTAALSVVAGVLTGLRIPSN